MVIEEERKTLKSTLDVDLNLSQHLMSTSQVNISCQHLMSIFQLDFPFLMPSISQYLEFNIYDCYFWVGFPVSAVKYFSKFGILHLRLHFWVGFPISAVKYFSKLKFCIYDWTFGVDFPFPLLSISQYLKFCIYDCTFGLDFPFPLLSISQYFKLCIFVLLTRYQSKNIWHWGDPSDQQHCTLAHTITAPPLFEVYNGA